MSVLIYFSINNDEIFDFGAEFFFIKKIMSNKIKGYHFAFAWIIRVRI